VAGDPDALKQTNEIKTAIPLLEPVELADEDISADALLTQRSIAQFLRRRLAHDHFTVKANRPALLADLERYFQDRSAPQFTQTSCGHGRIETRSLWVTAALNDYLSRQSPAAASPKRCAASTATCAPSAPICS